MLSYRWPTNSAVEKQDADGWEAWPTQPTQPSLSVPTGGQGRQRSAFTPATLSGSSPSPVLGQVGFDIQLLPILLLVLYFSTQFYTPLSVKWLYISIQHINNFFFYLAFRGRRWRGCRPRLCTLGGRRRITT